MSNTQRSFEEILNDALDGRLAPAEMVRFRAMLDGDAVRREEYECFQRMRALLLATGTERAPGDVARRVRAAIDGGAPAGNGAGRRRPGRLRQMGWIRSAALFLALITGTAIVVQESPWRSRTGGGEPSVLSDWSAAEGGGPRRGEDVGASFRDRNKDGQGGPHPLSPAAPGGAEGGAKAEAVEGFARKMADSRSGPGPAGTPAQALRIRDALEAAEADLQRVERQLHLYSLQMPSVHPAPGERADDGRVSVIDAVATLGRNLGTLSEADVLSASFEFLAEEGDRLLSRLADSSGDVRRASPEEGLAAKGSDLRGGAPAERAPRAGTASPGVPATAPCYLVSGPDAVASVGRSTGSEPVRLGDLLLRDSPEAMKLDAEAEPSYAFFLVSLDAPGAVDLVSTIESQAGLSVRALNRPEDGGSGLIAPGAAAENRREETTRIVLIALDR